MLLGEEGNTGRAFGCRLICGNALYIPAFTLGAVDQSLGGLQKKRHCGLPSSEFSGSGLPLSESH